MFKLNSCLVCGSSNIESFLVCKDYTFSKEQFSIDSCKQCGFKFTNPRPENNVIGSYYKADEYISHTNTKKGLVNRLYHYVRNYTLSKKVQLISSYVSRGTVLDYGCGTGMFLSACKKYGWNTIGMEPDDQARELAKNQGLNILFNKEQINEIAASGSLNVITLWHVLEHVTDLKETLQCFKSLLHKDGVLIIAVPNPNSYDAQYYKEFWAAYDVPRHLYHFEVNSIKQLLHNNGFKLIETKPMKFDSFYVSMLSEKYKTGSANLLKAFWIGLMSNLKAKNSSSYSSTIYVFKHS